MKIRWKAKRSPDFSLPWYERYGELEKYVKTEVAQTALSENLSFLNDNLNISCAELPLSWCFLWSVKDTRSYLHFIEERFSKISQIDLIPFIVFNKAILAIKGKVELSFTQYYALFSIFQYLLMVKLSNREHELQGVDLFDLDNYDTIFSRLEGKDPDRYKIFK